MIDYDHQSIFESDAVLASQFFTPRTALPDPERALMVAVLEDAVRCFLNHYGAADRKQRILYEEARAWVLSAERTGFCAFENVCDVLGGSNPAICAGSCWRGATSVAPRPPRRDAALLASDASSAGLGRAAHHRLAQPHASAYTPNQSPPLVEVFDVKGVLRARPQRTACGASAASQPAGVVRSKVPNWASCGAILSAGPTITMTPSVVGT